MTSTPVIDALEDRGVQMTLTIPEAVVREWSPSIHVSEHVTSGSSIAQFTDRVRSGYVAPPLRFEPPSAMIVGGRHFAVVSREHGLIESSTHTLGKHDWHQLFFSIDRTILHKKTDAAPIITGNSGHQSYYHWTIETAAVILVRRLFDAPAGPFVLPQITEPWQTDLRRFLAIDEPIIEVARNELAVFDEAILTNISGRAYSFAPHPIVLAQFSQTGLQQVDEKLPRRIYLSRLGVPGRRKMENEEAVAQLLGAHGFSIIDNGSLSIDQQVALFRNADVIVAPHGAALTNLVYTRDGKLGPKVIELMQESYLGRSFIKIAQAKNLCYTVIVNPDAQFHNYHHDRTWNCDLERLAQVLADVTA